MNYDNDRKWSDQYIPLIRQTVGPYLLVPATEEIDRTQAADLIILTGRDLTIACRVRRPGYVERWGWEFTMRSQRNNGVKTELSKIVDGWGDWMFYAFASNTPHPAFDRWFLIDLKSWRAHLLRDAQRPTPTIRKGKTPNKDKQTEFAWFDVRSFVGDPPLLIAASETVPSLMQQEAA